MLKFKIKSKKMWIIVGVILVAGIVIIGSLGGGVSTETIKVSKGDIKQYVEDTALVVSKDRQTVYIEGTGKVVDIYADVGDTVKKGQLLLSLDKSDLELQLKDAEAKVEAAKAQLKGTELVNYANSIDLAKAALNQAQVSFDSAKRNFDNVQNLYSSQAVSKDEFDKAQDTYKTAKAALDTAGLQLEDARKGAPEYVRSGYGAQLEQAVIFRDTIQRNIQKQEARADIDGVVLERLAEKNSIAANYKEAFVLGSVDNLELQADILAEDANRIKAGNEVEISGKAAGEEILKGEIVKVSPAAKNVISALGVNQKRVPVTIKLVDAAKLLRPGYSMDIKIITDTKSGVITVPDSAVFDFKGQSSVLVVEDGKAHARQVKKGLESGNSIEIIQGLKEGEILVVKPDNNIKEGARIKVQGK